MLQRKFFKKKDPQADLTGSKTGTVGTNILPFLNSVNFFKDICKNILLFDGLNNSLIE
jgi:hypothetical protein